jgi:alkylhydroperoxidase family enzyme
VQPQANLVGVKIPAYSSLAAFLAHYRALKSDASRSADDDQLLSEMSAVIATLSPEARAALDSTEDSASARRHRERAELQLRRELVARGIVAG